MRARHLPSVGCALLLPGLLACSLLHTPAWELPPAPPRDAPVVQAERLHRFTLENGSKLIVLEDPRLPLFSLGVSLRRGAAIESREQAGLASFTAELMERGAGERDALELAGVVDQLGASLSVGAGWDSMSVNVGGLSRDLDTLFGVLEDVALRPRFASGEAAKVRAEQLAALEQSKDDPGYLASTHLSRVLYPGHRFGLPQAGTPEALGALSAADARAFYARVFVPSNAVFYATGNIDAQDLLRRVEAAFGGWSGGAPPAPAAAAAAPTPQERRVRIVNRPDLGQAQIRVGHEGIARSEPERVEASLMNMVLGASGFSSRLMGRVRADAGLTYSIGSYFSMRRTPGPFAVATFTRVPEVGTVVGMILEELERIRSEPPQGQELANAQSMSTGRFGLGLETSAAVAGALVDLEVHGLPDDALDTYRGRVRAATAEDASRAARKRVHPERVAVVVVGPAEQIRPQLEHLGPVEVVEP